MTQTEELIVPTTTVKSSFTPLHIRPGTYALRLSDASLLKDAQGNWIKPEFGQRVKLTFDVHKITYDDSNDADPGTVGKQIVNKTNNIEQDVQLTCLVNIAYAKSVAYGSKELAHDANGNLIFETALKPTSKGMSKPAKFFMALGWKGPDASNTFNIKTLIGNWAQGTIADEAIKDAQGNDTEDFKSVIVKDSVTPLKAVVPKDMASLPVRSHTEVMPKQPERGEVTPIKAVEEDVKSPAKVEEFMAKVEKMKKQLDDGMLTQKGYDLALRSLKAEYGVE